MPRTKKTATFAARLGHRIRTQCESRDWSIRQLAIAAGIPQQSLDGYVRGENQPSAEKLKKIAIALGVSVDVLLE